MYWIVFAVSTLLSPPPPHDIVKALDSANTKVDVIYKLIIEEKVLDK